MMEIQVKDNTQKVLSETDQAIERALNIIGAEAEKYAKNLVLVDTGLLKNSITFVTQTHPGSTFKDVSSSDGGGGTAFVSKSSGGTRYGVEEQVELDEKNSVVIGTNVSYGIYVETKSYKGKGPNHFLTRAVNDHIDKYKRILEEEIKGALAK